MKVVCAWCKCHMSGSPDDKEISHGICSECEEVFNSQLEQLTKETLNG